MPRSGSWPRFVSNKELLRNTVFDSEDLVPPDYFRNRSRHSRWRPRSVHIATLDPDEILILHIIL